VLPATTKRWSLRVWTCGNFFCRSSIEEGKVVHSRPSSHQNAPQAPETRCWPLRCSPPTRWQPPPPAADPAAPRGQQLERIVREAQLERAAVLERVELDEPRADAGRALHPAGLRDELVRSHAVLGVEPAGAVLVARATRDEHVRHALAE